MKNKTIAFPSREPGVQGYTPELGEKKPASIMEARRGHYGKHHFIDTPLELTGRGITKLRRYKAEELTASGQYKAGWYSYEVTNRAFEKLAEEYAISMEMHLD